MFSVDEMISQHLPALSQKISGIENSPKILKTLKTVLRYLLHEKEFIQFEKDYPNLKGIDFVEQVLDYFNFTYSISDNDHEKIPDTGRVVIIANHPIGSLDGLALLQLVGRIRPDVKIVANQLLTQIKPLHNLLFPVDNMGAETRRNQIENITDHLCNEGAIIIFPAGEVSRLSVKGISDKPWNSGFLRLANKTRAPILPIHVKARNSLTFYGTSMLFKTLSTVMLVGEMFKHEKNEIKVTVGNPIPHNSYDCKNLPTKTKVGLFKKHVYKMPSGKSYFKTEAPIAHAENRIYLKKEIEECELLGETPDNKKIYLYDHKESTSIMREIGRLREISFRAVGEGSGMKRDIDQYDSHYHHLILWDQDDLEIVGAYRFADTKRVIEQNGVEALYVNSLFGYDKPMKPYLDRGLEMGRSFVQPKYWGKRSLDYLWQGIGAFIAKNPEFRYLFGPVSISDSFPPAARDILVWYYSHYYPHGNKAVNAKKPFRLTPDALNYASEIFCGDNAKEDFKRLKHSLDNLGVAVPTLYKQYSELCEEGGVTFIEFNVDPDFNNCLDGLVLVDIAKLKPNKRKRYIESHLKQ
ncbi:MAG: lysophospholipid acyltransferase family protein [Gammaproteobacteria bacterium]|nr:MAG: lysophospholipid acyltransferase family protein [Gammaproteobacteria bacterium]